MPTSAVADSSPAPILLVDDNAGNLLSLEAVLKPLGWPLVSATSGVEALKRVRERAFALALMDVSMPVLDGFQTVELIRRQQDLRYLPVVFLTALFRSEAAVQRGYELGAVDFVMKPFDPAILRAKVSALVALEQHNELVRRQQRCIAEESSRRERAEHANVRLAQSVRNSLCAILLTTQQLHRPETASDWRHAVDRIEHSARRLEGVLRSELEQLEIR